MLENLFKGLFDFNAVAVISITDFWLCLGFSFVLGLVMAFAYMYRIRYTKSFAVTSALLPAVVCIVIMLVNGNVGTGVAVLFTVIMCAMFILYNRIDFGSKRNSAMYKTFNITIPEDLGYSGLIKSAAATEI